MARVFLTIVLPLLLPTLLYVAWAVAVGRVDNDAGWRRAPWPWLAIAGLVLVVAVLGVATLHFGGETDGTYVPAQYKDGEVVPGHFAPPSEERR